MPEHVDHTDLYRIQVMQGRQIRRIENKLDEIERSPIVLSPFHKTIFGIFLAGCAWVLDTSHTNSVGLAAALVTLGEINNKVDKVPTETEIELRLMAIEALHPRGEKDAPVP